VCSGEICQGDPNCTATTPAVPDFLTYPRYYILNEDKTEIIAEGTICKDDKSFEVCENKLPREGHFVFRVAGIEPQGDSATWEFCGEKGSINTELAFSMKRGNCVAGPLVSAAEVCAGLLSVMEFSGTVLIEGVVLSALSVAETKALEMDIAGIVNSESVTIGSWENVEEGTEFNFDIQIVIENGIAYYHSNVENQVSNIQSTVLSSMTNGVFAAGLASALDSLSIANDPLKAATGFALEHLTLDSYYYASKSVDASTKTPLQIVYSSPITSSGHSSNGDTSSLSSFAVYPMVALSVMVLLGALIVARVMNRKPSHELLPADSAHSNRL
jgi:hypothetical protein